MAVSFWDTYIEDLVRAGWFHEVDGDTNLMRGVRASTMPTQAIGTKRFR